MSKIDELIQEYCPDGVEYISLGNLCKIETGKLNANAAVENGPYLFFTTAKEISRIDKYRWDTEALLIAGNANVGDVKHYEGKFDAYQRTYVLNNFDKRINVRFLYFFVSSALKSYLENRTNSAAMTYIVLSTLQDFKVPIPPLEVQKEIVNILDKFTQLEAELSAELSAELDARRKQYEYYRNQLLTFDESRERVRWSRLGDIMTIVRGASPRPINSFITTSEDGVNWIKIGDVKNGAKYITSTKEKITQAGAKKSRHLTAGDFVLSNSMSFGRPYILKIDGCIHDGWISMSNFENYLDSDFLYHLLNSDLVQRYWKQKASSGTVQNLNADIVRSTEIPIPEIDEQKKIAKLLDKFERLVNDINEGLPAELKARRQQYEYYRSKLLTFQETVA